MAEDTETTATAPSTAPSTETSTAPSTETSAPSAKVITEPISPIRLHRLEIDPSGDGWVATLTDGDEITQVKVPSRVASWKSNRMERAIAWAVRWIGLRAELEHFTRTNTEKGERATIDLLMIEEKNILVVAPTLRDALNAFAAPARHRPTFVQATPEDIDQATAEELAKQIRAVLWHSCDAYTAANGRVYRW
jgi:hypothetical protein